MTSKDHSAPNKILSKRDAIRLLDVIQTSLSCTTEAAFRKLLTDVKILIPFDYAVCTMASKSGRNPVAQYDLINISYPAEWLCRYVEKNYLFVDPIIKENFTHYPVQYWQDTYKKYNPPKQFVKEAADFNLRKGYSAGQENFIGTQGSIFSFSGDSIERGLRNKYILDRLTPHLHQALNRIVSTDMKFGEPIVLTSREKEILLWVKEGKTTWDISTILSLSQYTVQYHLKNIYRKLNATSRTHAVAIAIERKLIDL